MSEVHIKEYCSKELYPSLMNTRKRRKKLSRKKLVQNISHKSLKN